MLSVEGPKQVHVPDYESVGLGLKTFNTKVETTLGSRVVAKLIKLCVDLKLC